MNQVQSSPGKQSVGPTDGWRCEEGEMEGETGELQVETIAGRRGNQVEHLSPVCKPLSAPTSLTVLAGFSTSPPPPPPEIDLAPPFHSHQDERGRQGEREGGGGWKLKYIKGERSQK